MKNKLILIGGLILTLGLSSCSIYKPFTTSKTSETPHFYETITTPFINVEKTAEPGYIELTSEQLFKKYDAKDNFILFIHSTTCGHCQRMDENYLTPYMEETNTAIYSYITNTGDYSSYKEEFASYQPSGAIYMRDGSISGVPVFLVLYNGEVMDYFYGENAHCVDMVKALCITDENYVAPSNAISDTEETPE